MRPGRMRHRLVYQERTTALDSKNAPQETAAGWVDVTTLRADVRTLSFKEQQELSHLGSTVTHEVKTYKPDVTLSSKGRFVLGGTTVLWITAGPSNTDLHNRELVMHCTVNAGETP